MHPQYIYCYFMPCCENKSVYKKKKVNIGTANNYIKQMKTQVFWILLQMGFTIVCQEYEAKIFW
jgi:hypothetical protein